MIDFKSYYLRAKYSFVAPPLSEYTPTLTREELIRRSRILVIDDETPPLIEDLRREGFSVDHDSIGSEITKINRGLYTIVILDYSGIGRNFGKNQGLDLLREIKRCNPACYVVAYTSKSLKIHQSDFYRLADATLSKDSGWSETIEKVEASLREAYDVARLWDSVLTLCKADNKQRKILTRALAVAIETNNEEHIMAKLGKLVGASVSDTLVGSISQSIFSLAVKAVVGP